MEMRDQASDLEQALDALVAGDQREHESVALRRQRPAGEQRQPGRVHELQPTEVHDQAAAARADLGEAFLELWHGAHVELADRGDADLAVALMGDLDAKGRWQELVGQWGTDSGVGEYRGPPPALASRAAPTVPVEGPPARGSRSVEARACEARTLPDCRYRHVRAASQAPRSRDRRQDPVALESGEGAVSALRVHQGPGDR